MSGRAGRPEGAAGAGVSPRPRTGRRPGDPGTRDAILAAARAEFGARGFDHATIRAIARGAGVDPALVHHYFGTKEELFEASLVLPMEPAAVLPELLRADPDRVGEGVVRTFLCTWEAPANRPTFMAMLRSVVGDEAAAALVRDLLTRSVFGPLATTVPAPDAGLRATLVGTQLIGLALARYVGRVEPLASADVDTLAAAVGPTVQRYLLGDIGL